MNLLEPIDAAKLLGPAPVPYLKGLTDVERVMFARMWQTLLSKAYKNQLLTKYYNAHSFFRDFGISVPPQMRNLHCALGWPAKAVQGLARKHVFEGFTLEGRSNPFDVDEILVRNNFELELVQAITSTYKHSCSFLTVTAGDRDAGEPPIVIQARSAEFATALWDQRRRELEAALVITDQKDARPTGLLLFTREWVIRLDCDDIGRWSVDREIHRLKRVPVEMLVYDPQLSRPFGHSRISREVRYLTDAAVRTLARTEVAAEFFASPQRYVLGVDKDNFDLEGWSAVTGRFLAVEMNEEGKNPVMGQFSQMSMDPHLSMYRQLAQNFCAATNLPMSSVGLFADNPASAEAMQAAEYALSDEAEYQWRVFRPALRRLVQDIVMLRDGLFEPPVESWRLGVKTTPARYVSPQAASDYIVKVASVLPQICGTNVALRRAGFTVEEIEEMQSDIAQVEVRELLEGLGGQDSSELNDNGDQAQY